MPRTHAADLRTQFEKCIREDGTMDTVIYEEFFKRNRLEDCPRFFLWELLVQRFQLNGSIVRKHLWMRAK